MITSKLILVIDDDADLRDVLSEILRQEGYAVTEQPSGRDIYNIIQSVKPDLIILDVMLDGVDGRDICRKLKKHQIVKLIPVIVVSAGFGLKDMKQKDCCADDYLPKPFDIDELLDKVSRLLSR